MQFYREAGFLVLGSRLRRIGDNFINDVNKTYAAHDIDFDAAWFPVFYILSNKKEVSIIEIATDLNLSHSAVSQMVKNLSEKGLLKSRSSKVDARQKAISFTAKGSKLFLKIKPVWNALQQAMEELFETKNKSNNILQLLTDMEVNLNKESLYSRIENKLSQ